LRSIRALKWLLESDSAVRWPVMRDLTGTPPKQLRLSDRHRRMGSTASRPPILVWQAGRGARRTRVCWLPSIVSLSWWAQGKNGHLLSQRAPRQGAGASPGSALGSPSALEMLRNIAICLRRPSTMGMRCRLKSNARVWWRRCRRGKFSPLAANWARRPLGNSIVFTLPNARARGCLATRGHASTYLGHITQNQGSSEIY